MKKFLFQGDSITDAGRARDWDLSLGSGYSTVVAATLGTEFPGEYEFINRAISGNRIVDLYARIKTDIINLKPDALSILIGINDVWHEVNHQNGVSAEKYEKIYDMLIEEILEALPDIKIYILEPFLLTEKLQMKTGIIFIQKLSKEHREQKELQKNMILYLFPFRINLMLPSRLQIAHTGLRKVFTPLLWDTVLLPMLSLKQSKTNDIKKGM